MRAEPRLSTWSRRAVLVVAALASIATSRARWHVAATLPPPLPVTAKGTLVTVEASQEPEVHSREGTAIDKPCAREEKTPWKGRGTYALKPGAELVYVSIGGYCSGGLCSRCEEPPASFVRVTKVEPIAAPAP